MACNILNFNRPKGFLQLNGGDTKTTAVNSKMVIGNAAVADAITAEPTDMLTVAGNISASGNITGNQYHMTYHNMGNVGDIEVYIPINSTVDSNATSYQRQWVAPFDGSLEKIRLYAESAGGNTVCKLYVNGDFNAGDSANSTSDTKNISATTTATFTFSSGNTYSAGDLIRVTINGTNDLDDVNIVCIWNYDTSTL